jgi:hypothetical protein
MLRLGLLLMVGCGSYHPGSFKSWQKTKFVGQRATIGCVDIAVERRPDRDDQAVLAYKFGNGCDEKRTIDLANVRVVGRDADGAEVDLRPWDPTLEVRPLALDARLVGGEVLAYSSERPLEQVCVDVASLVRATPARWMCFAREPEPPKVDPGNTAAPSDQEVL